MGFFNPGLLWFALGGSIPIIIHLLHRQKFKRVRWAAMEFLLAALRKTQRRLRLENLILLLLRILIMVILSLAVARPFFRETPLEALGESDTHHIFVLDVSYSMGYKRAQNTSLDVAKKAAEAVLKDIRPGQSDRFTLLTLSTFPEVIQKGLARKDKFLDMVRELKISDYGTSVLNTMLEIRNLLDDPQIRNRDLRIYLFTDMQRLGWEFRDEAEGKKFGQLLKALSTRDHTRFFVYDAGTPDAINHAVVGLRVENRAVTTRRSTRFTAEIHNFSPTPISSKGVSFYIDDTLFKTEQVILPPNATVPVNFDYTFAAPGPHLVRAALDADYLDTDDSRHLAVDVRNSLRCLAVDGEPKDSPKERETYALVLALDPTREGLYFSVDEKTVELFTAEGLDKYDFLVLANVQSLSPDKIEKVEQFVERGGGLFLTMGSRVDKISFNKDFWKEGKGLSPAMLEEVVGMAPEGLERGVERRLLFKADHPVFRTWRDKLRAQIGEMVFWKFYKTAGSDPLRVAARFDDNFGSPAFLEKNHGEGKVLLYTSTIDADWTDGIPGKAPYLPLAWNIGEHLSTRPAARRNLFVGDLIQLELPAEQYQPPFTLETPAEGGLILSASLGKDDKFFRLFFPNKAVEKPDAPKVLQNEGLRHAGKYKLLRRADKEEDRLMAYFAVNVPPRSSSPEEIHEAEGNLDRISKEEIQQRFPEFKVEFRGEKKQGEQQIDVAPPPAGGVWKYLLYLLLGFMLLESTLAWLFGRAKQ